MRSCLWICPSEMENAEGRGFLTACQPLLLLLWGQIPPRRFKSVHMEYVLMQQAFAYYKCSWLWSMRRWVGNKQIKAPKSLSNSSRLSLKLSRPKVVEKLQRLVFTFQKLQTLGCKVTHLCHILSHWCWGSIMGKPYDWIQALRRGLFGMEPLHNANSCLLNRFTNFRGEGTMGWLAFVSLTLCFCHAV